MGYFKEIFAYREMIRSLVHRDLKGRYKGSVLGFAWTFINPLLQLAVYTLVFSVIMRAGIEDYYLYLFVALVPWIFFSSSVANGAGCIRAQGGMVTKIYFPREVIPLSHVISQFVNMVLSLLVVFAVLIIAGKGLNPLALLFLPLVMVLEFLIALGVTMMISAITVTFRDLEYLTGVIVMAWQFLTPVMYGVDMIPVELIPFFNINPMTSVIVAYRDILYYGTMPELATLLNAVVFGVIVVVLGAIVFARMKRGFAEAL